MHGAPALWLGALLLCVFAAPANAQNQLPVFNDGASAVREIPENVLGGVPVGRPIVARVPGAGDTVTYLRGGPDSGFFRMDQSGQLWTFQTQSGESIYDYETQPVYTFIMAADANGDSDRRTTIAVTVRLIDQAEPLAPTDVVVEPAEPGSVSSLTVNWRKPADNEGRAPIAGYHLRYKKTADPESAYIALINVPGENTLEYTISTALEPDTDYTVQVRAFSVEGESPWATGSVTSTAHDFRARSLKFALAAVGRQAATEMVDVLGERFDALRRAEGTQRAPAESRGMQAAPGAGFAGAPPSLAETPAGTGFAPPARMAGRTAFAAAHAEPDGIPSGRFQVLLGEAPTRGAAFWARGSVSAFEGKPEDAGSFSMKGEVVGAHLGFDYRPSNSNTLVGFAISHSGGKVDFSDDHIEGDIETALSSITPYLHWSPFPGVGVYGMLGYGLGDVEVVDSTIGLEDGETDIETRMLAFGGRGDLMRVGAFDYGLNLDAFVVDTEAEAAEHFTDVEAGASMLRLSLEGRNAFERSAEERVESHFEVAARVDGGDAETGTGVEFGAGFRYSNMRLGIDIAAGARYLLVHRDNDFEEWGANLSATYDPGAYGSGFALSLRPAWGMAESGVAALWEGGLQPRRPAVGGGFRPGHLDMELGYGASLLGGRAVLTPFGELRLRGSDDTRLRLGTRINAGESLGKLRLNLFGETRMLRRARDEGRIGIDASFEF